ncbi:MAG: hypothetical protein AB4290_16570 [Spirulina sp.]
MSARHSEVSSTGWLDMANAHQETIRHPPTSIRNGLDWSGIVPWEFYPRIVPSPKRSQNFLKNSSAEWERTTYNRQNKKHIN